MLRHVTAHAESTCNAISRTSALGGARSAASDAAGTQTVADRDKRLARGGPTTACNGAGRAQDRGIPFGLRQAGHGEPRPLATRSGTPPRVSRTSAAMVAILAALRRRVQSMAKTD